MASSADLVLKNFQYQIENITPTNSRPRKNFRWLDPNRVDPDSSAGIIRVFVVLWNGSDDDEEPTDITERYATHEYKIEIYYPSELKVEDLQEIVLQDRHDLIKALRTTSNFNGISASASTTDTGLKSRVRISDELVLEDQTWIFRQEWRCLIGEGE